MFYTYIVLIHNSYTILKVTLPELLQYNRKGESRHHCGNLLFFCSIFLFQKSLQSSDYQKFSSIEMFLPLQRY